MSITAIYNEYLKSSGVSTDTRNLEKNQIFFALKGPNFDGNKYAFDALNSGALAVVADDPSLKSHPSIYVVKDVLLTLQRLSRHHREQFDFPVLAITGSNGKTTTKELVHAVLSTELKAEATKGNLNNHIGVPLTLLSVTKPLDILIVEMGANHIGEIADLCQIAQPDYGLITNIGYAHIEGFGSYQGVMKGKGELYQHLSEHQGLIFYNKKDDVVGGLLPNGALAYPYVDDVSFKMDNVTLSFRPKGYNKYSKTNLVGEYNISNITCAITIGRYFGVSDYGIQSAIVGYLPTNNRSQIISKANVELILDAYNANPSSMKHSIVSLARSRHNKKKSLILGQMKELGGESIGMHKDILLLIAQYKWHKVILVGEFFAKADEEGRYPHYKNVEDLLQNAKAIKKSLQHTICLIKASRSERLESVEKIFDKR